MAGWKLLVGTAVMPQCRTRLKPSSTRSSVTSVNSSHLIDAIPLCFISNCPSQLKRNVTVLTGIADLSSVVLWLWAIVLFVILPVCVDWDRVNRG
jgi:hypothetical protein